MRAVRSHRRSGRRVRRGVRRITRRITSRPARPGLINGHRDAGVATSRMGAAASGVCVGAGVPSIAAGAALSTHRAVRDRGRRWNAEILRPRMSGSTGLPQFKLVASAGMAGMSFDQALAKCPFRSVVTPSGKVSGMVEAIIVVLGPPTRLHPKMVERLGSDVARGRAMLVVAEYEASLRRVLELVDALALAAAGGAAWPPRGRRDPTPVDDGGWTVEGSPSSPALPASAASAA
jgi:hypothetical protein